MIRRAVSLALVLFAGTALFYISRFWDFRLWGREGLLGGLLAVWLRGTPPAPYELLSGSDPAGTSSFTVQQLRSCLSARRRVC